MKKVAMNKKIMSLSNKIAMAITDETEEILLHAEEIIKDFVPARKVKSILKAIESDLDNEGIEAKFDYRVTREALRKTASDEVTDEELDEVKTAVVNAIVEEMEDVLEDADEISDEVVSKFNPKNQFEVEAKLKRTVESSLSYNGIKCLFARNKKAPVKKEASKKTIMDKIKSSK